VALALVWEEQSKSDREILRSNKEVCGRVKGLQNILHQSSFEQTEQILSVIYQSRHVFIKIFFNVSYG